MGSREEAFFRADEPVGREPVEDFMTRARGDLVALAYVMTGGQDEAQDVVHEVFARLLCVDLSEVHDLWSYARRAVTNECISWGRRISRGTRRSQALRAEWDRVLRTQPDPFGRVEILSAMTSLSNRQRAAVVLRYYLDWDDDAIAETLDCAPATVRSMLSRALRKLQADLTERGVSE